MGLWFFVKPNRGFTSCLVYLLESRALFEAIICVVYAELLLSSFIFHNLAKNAKYRSDTRFTKWNHIQDYILLFIYS